MASDEHVRAMTLRAWFEDADAHDAQVSTARLHGPLSVALEQRPTMPARELLQTLGAISEEGVSLLDVTVESVRLDELYRPLGKIGHLARCEEFNRCWLWLEPRAVDD